ncbi:MAG: DnaJ domain-containing protein [Pseudomonadota bacterium]
MNPYQILGISENASREEIKKAYRREAMKWHPDRCENSAEARDRFHKAAEAYRMLTERPDNRSQRSDGQYSEQQDSSRQSQSNENHSGEKTEDPFADSVFWDVMLDYAIKLAQNGLEENTIVVSLTQKGCPQKLARMIAEKAFNIHAHYEVNNRGRQKSNPDAFSFKQERLENELIGAYIGQRSFFWSPKGTLEYYRVLFSELGQKSKMNPFNWISINRRLARLFSFALLMYAVIALAIDIYPGPSEYKLLPDIAMLQIPFLILGLMLLWLLYRKMWLFFIILTAASLTCLSIFNRFMPTVLYQDRFEMLLISAICFTPFAVTAMFANTIYFYKATRMIRAADHLFDQQIDKLVWIKNRAGTTVTAPLLALVAAAICSTYLLPQNSELSRLFALGRPIIQTDINQEAEQKIKVQLDEAEQFFLLGEKNFNRKPPDYMRAEMAYSNAADNGSILAAYKLGYMYYTGTGVDQNDILAIENFERATRAPLAFQPHSLQQTTQFLAESYNSLGIMYQAGLGTRKDLSKARQMFKKGEKFGSKRATENLAAFNKNSNTRQRSALLEPRY